MSKIDERTSQIEKKSRALMSLFLMIMLASSSMILISSLQPSELNRSPIPARIAYTSHSPILIDGNSDFIMGSNGVVSGSGIESNPYIIEGWEINSSSAHGIEIQNSNVHFIVKDCYIYDGNLANYHGIRLYNCQNGTLFRNMCVNNIEGINLWISSNNTLLNNTCVYNDANGITIISSNDILLVNNNCSNNYGGIEFWDSCTNITLNGNICNDNFRGIGMEGSFDTIINNLLSNNIYGIWLYQQSNHSTIVNNTCVNNAFGICLEPLSNNNTLIGNNCSYNENGIDLRSSSNNTLSDNICVLNNLYGIRSTSSNNSLILNNSCIGNDVGIGLTSSRYNILCNNSLTDNRVGIQAYESDNNTIIGNDCWNNDQGIYLISSNGYEISNNSCGSDSYDFHGINLDYSNNSIIRQNICTGVYEGIYLLSSNHDILIQNSLIYCIEEGIRVDPACNNNTFYGNNFINNNGAGYSYDVNCIQARDDGLNNLWNSTGYGNYWSDWTTPDNDFDGIVDYPYNLSGSSGAKDYYPLAIATEDAVDPVTAISISGSSATLGWYISNVTISLSASDFGSGVNATYYRMSQSESWVEYLSPINITEDGLFTIEYYSIDNESNSETSKTAHVKIDKTSPTLILDQDSGFDVTVNYTTITWTGSDATSGLNRYEVSIDGGTYSSVGMATSHNFTNLENGMHNVTIRAIDNASNSYYQSIQFTVNISSTSDNLMLYISMIVIIIVAVIIMALFMMMRKKKAPPMKFVEMKAEPPAPPPVN